MARARIKSAAGWIGIGLLYLVGPAAIGLSERASKANETLPWPTIIGVMLVASFAGALLLWAYKSGNDAG